MSYYEKNARAIKAAKLVAGALQIAAGSAATAHAWLATKATDRDWEYLAQFAQVNVASETTRGLVIESLAAKAVHS